MWSKATPRRISHVDLTAASHLKDQRKNSSASGSDGLAGDRRRRTAESVVSEKSI